MIINHPMAGKNQTGAERLAQAQSKGGGTQGGSGDRGQEGFPKREGPGDSGAESGWVWSGKGREEGSAARPLVKKRK